MGAFAEFCIVPFLLFLCFLFGEIAKPVNAEKCWCVAKPSSSEEELQKNIDYACGEAGVNCSAIKRDGSCFNPNTKASHASFAMNYYFQIHQRQNHTCYFQNTALIAISDPSYGSCTYQGGESPPQPQSKTWCLAKPGSDDTTLKNMVDYICTKLSCQDIEEGNACYNPNTLLNHASYVMNLFYHTAQGQNCNFNNSGILVRTNPSYGSCTYI